jgi:hypothetical protein
MSLLLYHILMLFAPACLQSVRLLTPVKWRPVVEFAHTHPKRQLPRAAHSSNTVACYREVLADSEEATTGTADTDTANSSTNNKENASGFTLSSFNNSSSSSAVASQKSALLQQGKSTAAARNQRLPQTVSTAAKGARGLSTASTATSAGGKKQRAVAAPAAVAALAVAAATALAAAAATADITFVTSLPDALPCEVADAARPEARVGVGLLTWSHDSRYLATRSDVSPAVLWVWDASTLRLVAAVQFARAVLALRWSPASAFLAVATGARRVYLWQPEPHGVGWLDAPCSSSGSSSSGSSSRSITNDSVTGEPQPVFRVLDVRWHPAGDSLVMLSRDRMIGVRLEQQAEGEEAVLADVSSSSGVVCKGDGCEAAALVVA